MTVTATPEGTPGRRTAWAVPAFDTVRARPGRLRALHVLHSALYIGEQCTGPLYGRAERLAARNGGFRAPGRIRDNAIPSAGLVG